jgi:predicted RNA methylase
VLLTGEITDAKKEFQAFYTPPEIADRVMTLAGIEPGMLVLEPSAGTGALANPALGLGAEVTCVEINPDLRIEVTCGVTWFCADFLDIRSAVHLGGPFDRVVMNPPFSRQQDARHVLHAAAMLKPGGRLVAIMSAGVMFRETQAYREVRQLAEHGGSIIHLPQGSFRLSGTDVNTCLVTVRG